MNKNFFFFRFTHSKAVWRGAMGGDDGRCALDIGANTVLFSVLLAPIPGFLRVGGIGIMFIMLVSVTNWRRCRARAGERRRACSRG